MTTQSRTMHIRHLRNDHEAAIVAHAREVERLDKLRASTNPLDADHVQAQEERVLRAERRVVRTVSALLVVGER